jgi:hypothetical protein
MELLIFENLGVYGNTLKIGVIALKSLIKTTREVLIVTR